MSKQNMIYTYNRVLFNFIKEAKIYCNMDQPRGHYDKWNKPVTNYCMIPLTWGTLSSQSHKDRKHYLGCLGLEGKENRDLLFIVYRVCFTRWKELWGDSPGGPIAGNSSCNAGDIGPIPGRGTRIPHSTAQLSPRAL